MPTSKPSRIKKDKDDQKSAGQKSMSFARSAAPKSSPSRGHSQAAASAAPVVELSTADKATAASIDLSFQIAPEQHAQALYRLYRSTALWFLAQMPSNLHLDRTGDSDSTRQSLDAAACEWWDCACATWPTTILTCEAGSACLCPLCTEQQYHLLKEISR
jgi:hypothetical protein